MGGPLRGYSRDALPGRSLDLNEFAQIVCDLEYGNVRGGGASLYSAPPHVASAFATYDCDGSGYLEIAELQPALQGTQTAANRAADRGHS